MNFTREPIILTVITPKEGSKLVIRNALGGQEDIFVDAIEVVSFQEVVFFRSLERPKSFLFPTSHYEVLEVKETRMVLKNASAEKSIKIGGGARPSEERKPQEDRRPQEEKKPQEERKPQEENRPRPHEEGRDKKKDKKRLKRRKPMPEDMKNQEQIEKPQGGDAQDETQVSSSVLKKLFPPPNVLIKERLARFKSEEFLEENILPERVEEEKKENSHEKSDEEKIVPFSEEPKEEKPENNNQDSSGSEDNEKNKEDSEE